MNIRALHFVLDIDGDGSVSGWEALEAAKWLFNLPGRLFVEGLGNIPWVAEAFGIKASLATGYASFNSLAATGATLVFWLGALWLLTRIGSGKNAPSAESQPDTQKKPRYRGPIPRNRPSSRNHI